VRAAVVVFDGVDELDALGPYEVLATARELGGEVVVRLATLRPAEWVRGAHDVVLRPHEVLPERLDLVVVPGGGWNDGSPTGARAEVAAGALPAAIAARHAAGATVASVCTGAMIVAAAGLVAGRPGITHRSAHHDLVAAGAELRPNARVVDDGDLLTAGGITAGIDLGLWIVERELGLDLAQRVAAELEHERRATAVRPGGA